MSRIFAFCLLVFFFASGETSIAQRNDNDFLELLLKNEPLYVGKSSEEVVSLLGKPQSVVGNLSDGSWNYRFALQPTDATRITGYTIFFKSNRVSMLRPIQTELLLFQIGTFPGFIGSKARQVSVMEGFRSPRNPEKLTASERIQFFKELLKRIEIAESKKENLELSVECQFFMFLKTILKTFHIDDTKTSDGNSGKMDLSTIRGDIQRLIK